MRHLSHRSCEADKSASLQEFWKLLKTDYHFLHLLKMGRQSRHLFLLNLIGQAILNTKWHPVPEEVVSSTGLVSSWKEVNVLKYEPVVKVGGR